MGVLHNHSEQELIMGKRRDRVIGGTPPYLWKVGNTRWDRLGYDSFDQKNYYDWLGVCKWIVRAGRRRVVVYEYGLDKAKAKACRIRGWSQNEITEVVRLCK
jgi:hypothetical protein